MEELSRIQLDVRRGEVLAGKYRVDRVLGAGGMGIVIAAQHLGLHQKVAIKFLLPEALEDPEAATRFDREARAAAKIKGEHIARVMDVGTLESGVPFMVMEYLEGEDLAARLRREHRLPVEEAVELVLQTCEVLAEAHGLGIIHRDLKPANLFCLRGPDGAVSIKVLDFGISKLVGPNTAHTVTITKTSALVGSPTYMSPEQIQSARHVDARTDIWAVGVVLYELLAGRVPFSGQSIPEICLKVAKRRVPPIHRFRPETPAELEAAMLMCLEKDRTRRFSSVLELSLALAPIASDRALISIQRISQLAGSDRRTGRPPALPSREKTVHSSAFPPRERRSMAPNRGSVAPNRGSVAPSRGSVAPSRGSVAPSRDVPTSWWKAKWSVVRGGWRGPMGGVAAAVLGLTGAALVAAELISSKRAPATADAPLVSSSSTQTVAPPSASSAAPASNPSTVASTAPAVPAPELDCRINFNSVPVSTVWLDGHKIGTTPNLGVAASPGAHAVVFENPAHGRLTTNVECKGGETKAVTVRLGRSTDAPAGATRAEANRHK